MQNPAQARRTFHLLVLGAAIAVAGAALLQFIRPQPLLILDHPVELREALISPDGLTLVAARDEQREFSSDGTRFDTPAGFAWNIQTGALIGRFGHSNRLQAMALQAFSVDGRYLLTNAPILNEGLQVWDTQNWEVMYQESGCVNCELDFSPSGRYIAATFSGTDEKLRVYYVDRGRDEHIELPPLLGGPEAGLNLPRFSPDEKLLALGNSISPQSARIAIWDLVTGLRWNIYEQPSALLAMNWSADGRYLMTLGEDGRRRIWDARTGQQREEAEDAFIAQAFPEEDSAYSVSISGSRLSVFAATES